MDTFVGLMAMLKSDICAETDVCATTMFPGANAVTVPPLKDAPLPLLLAVGVAVMVRVAVDPDCSEIGPQLILTFVVAPLPHVPELMLPLMFVSGMKVTPGLMSAVMVILLARSGPLLVIV